MLAQYPGEDTRLTSKKELAGWYAYGFAAEVFVICGMGKSSIYLELFEGIQRPEVLGVIYAFSHSDLILVPLYSVTNPDAPFTTYRSRNTNSSP